MCRDEVSLLLLAGNVILEYGRTPLLDQVCTISHTPVTLLKNPEIQESAYSVDTTVLLFTPMIHL